MVRYLGQSAVLRLLDRLERAGREEREDRRAQAGDIALRHQHRLVQHVRVDLIEHLVLLRDAAAVDDAADRHAVLFHALENDARVEGGAFDGGEELVLRGVRQVPAERDAAEFGIHQHRAVAVVPGQAQQPGLPGAVVVESLATASATDVPARRAIASKMSPVAESPASMPAMLRMNRALHDAADARDQLRVLGDGHDAGRRADDVDDVAGAARRRRSRPNARRTRRPESGMPARSPSFAAHSGDSVPAIWSEVA